MRPSLPIPPPAPSLPLRRIVSPRSAIRTPVPAYRCPDVSIIIPARNEESNLRVCLESLATQTGVTFEITVVDDASTDRTREIALGFPGVRVISPKVLPIEMAANSCTGKNNAVIAGARNARSPWLLFPDPDPIHQP